MKVPISIKLRYIVIKHNAYSLPFPLSKRGVFNMGQDEVYRILKKKDWMTAQEIAEILECNPNGVRRCLRVMFDFGEVSRKIVYLNKYAYKIKNL